MNEKQRFGLIVGLIVLIIACITGLIISSVVNGLNVNNSPTVSFITGTGVIVILMIIGIIQNTSIHNTTVETKSLVNGGLDQRVRDVVQEVMKELPIVKGVIEDVVTHEKVLVPTVSDPSPEIPPVTP